ncbi:MAG: inosine/guanosine kinase [Bdellovibrionales bacterium CG12_big_fil_rev_8_21_14_0_65_38_15]|nr:MAG: inosine/guanosine kinase [Bdellovibrionales bacterium CG22_combo_CG10-13_8_21_14_all_38_13]PIQ55353.1 MAG: inosine/guanosine kinase [Bdellovibrionales bacterium CG12_big_fil_rev_8_21_14_0_65_38_15]PIR30573.1 MAG: inosine/guanosine kinase [Bdellovibrionales bacterium CG11_big_fil_rev_8_21_14_0_20_38_13]
MKFPGRRKTKHYFPVQSESRISLEWDLDAADEIYIVGIDQLIVDVEAEVEDAVLIEAELNKGESVVLPDQTMEALTLELRNKNKILGVYAGGSIGNTLHNYSVLSDDRSIALGTISKNMSVGDDAFKYICTTNSHVDFSYLKPVEGPMARALCLITPDRERTFAIAKGIMNDLTADAIPDEVIEKSAALMISTYLLRDENAPMFKATLHAVKVAKKAGVPVILSLGTSGIVRERQDFLRSFLRDYVTVAAMNEVEASALTGEEDPLLNCEKLLDYVDLALLTVGPRGLYLAGFSDEEYLRETKDMIHSKSIGEYNKYEYSRAMKLADCTKPVKIYSHINPYMGGPGKVISTNGAGDAALAALLHDMAANQYHRRLIPKSPKHGSSFLTYSSFHQVAKYANRVSFEVLRQNSPRLSRGLPEREDSLEEAYWAR